VRDNRNHGHRDKKYDHHREFAPLPNGIWQPSIRLGIKPIDIAAPTTLLTEQPVSLPPFRVGLLFEIAINVLCPFPRSAEPVHHLFPFLVAFKCHVPFAEQIMA